MNNGPAAPQLAAARRRRGMGRDARLYALGLGLGLCVLVPQTFAVAGRHALENYGPGAADAAIARLNIVRVSWSVLPS